MLRQGKWAWEGHKRYDLDQTFEQNLPANEVRRGSTSHVSQGERWKKTCLTRNQFLRIVREGQWECLPLSTLLSKGWVSRTSGAEGLGKKSRGAFTLCSCDSTCVFVCVCVCLHCFAERRKTQTGNVLERVVHFNFIIWCPRACEVSNKNVFMQSASIFDFSLLPVSLSLLSVFNYLQFLRKKREK